MAIQVQLRRGNETDNDALTGAQGELTFDTTINGIRVHDGSTAGGHPIGTGITAAAPNFTFTNTATEDTDGGRESIVTFKGKQSGGELSTLAQIQASHDGTADDQKADLIFRTNDGSDGASPTERLRIDSAGFLDSISTSNDIARFSGPNSGGLTFRNDTSHEIQIHTGTNDALIFGTNGENERMRITSAGRVAIGTTSPDSPLHVEGASGTQLVVEATSGDFAQIDFKIGGTQKGAIWTYEATDLMGFYTPSGWGQNFYTNGSERMRIDSSGDLNIVNTGQASLNFTTDGSTDYARITGGKSGSGVGDLRFFTYSGGIGESMRIHSSGTLQIGTATNSGYGPLQIGNTSAAATTLQLLSGSSQGGFVHFGDATSGSGRYAGYVQYDHGSNFMAFGTSATEKMRVDSSGDVLIGMTAPTGSEQLALSVNSSVNFGIGIKGTSASNNAVYARFYNASGATAGEIAQSGSTSTNFTTSSDYRIKENLTDISDGITRVKQLSPKRFNFIGETDRTVDGFLAHEAQTVVPEAVTGTKDAIQVWKESDDLPDGVSAGDNKLDDDGNTIPELQGIDQAKLVPLLTAALQEAIAKIETLETKVAALEAE